LQISSLTVTYPKHIGYDSALQSFLPPTAHCSAGVVTSSFRTLYWICSPLHAISAHSGYQRALVYAAIPVFIAPTQPGHSMWGRNGEF